ncbi:MAG: hypothetical protein AB8B58_17025 [Roseobacter sp.]
MSSTAPQTTLRRQVFYIPGYDPFPPRRYRELYRREAVKQAAISGYKVEVTPRDRRQTYGWRVEGDFDGDHVTTDIDVLVWSDIVRASRPDSIVLTYVDMVKTAWIYLCSGALFRLMRLRKGPVIAALFPVVALLLQAQLAVFVGWLVWFSAGSLVSGPVKAAFVLPAALAAYAVLRAFQHWDQKFFAYYLMHDFSFSAAGKGAYAPELHARIDEFSDHIARALQSDVDEVLVIGHSSGAHLAVSAVSKVLRDAQKPPATAFGLLSLGQVVPMITFLPKAHQLRADLKFLSRAGDVFWADVSAPGDGGCFALCDPVVVSGQGGKRRGPLVFSAAYADTLSPELRKSLRWRFFRLHFQYLCAFDRPRDYDYFRITAGPLSLSERYKGRKSSKSRILQPVTAFKDVA